MARQGFVPSKATHRHTEHRFPKLPTHASRAEHTHLVHTLVAQHAACAGCSSPAGRRAQSGQCPASARNGARKGLMQRICLAGVRQNLDLDLEQRTHWVPVQPGGGGRPARPGAGGAGRTTVHPTFRCCMPPSTASTQQPAASGTQCIQRLLAGTELVFPLTDMQVVGARSALGSAGRQRQAAPGSAMRRYGRQQQAAPAGKQASRHAGMLARTPSAERRVPSAGRTAHVCTRCALRAASDRRAAVRLSPGPGPGPGSHPSTTAPQTTGLCLIPARARACVRVWGPACFLLHRRRPSLTFLGDWRLATSPAAPRTQSISQCILIRPRPCAPPAARRPPDGGARWGVGAGRGGTGSKAQ